MHLCMCCEKLFVFVFSFLSVFSAAQCGRWNQAQSDTAIKQHLVKMGWSLLHLWPSGRSMCMGAHVLVWESCSQQKCWHTMASAGDSANLNSLRKAPKKKEKHISLKMQKEKKKIQAAGETFAV